MPTLGPLSSFRVRLLLVLALLLVATLGVQFYLNRRAEQRVARTIAEQEQALAAGIALAVQSLSTSRMKDLDGGRFLTRERAAGRVTNVLILKDEGGSTPNRLDSDDAIDDSLDPAYNPEQLDDGTIRYVRLAQVPLPRLVNPEEAAANAQPVAGEPRAFVIPTQTSRGRYYIVVALGTGSQLGTDEPAWRDVSPLLPTLSVLLLATLATIFLVWRFTRPIQELSSAARRVAAGDFSFHVPAAERSDEMGALARVFNEMIAQLGRLRELEAQLHQAERSAVVGRLASAIAHEVRNPLNYINLTLDHLRTKLAPDDPQKRAVVERLTDQLKVEVQRINTRISEFLSYTRPARLTLRPLDLRAMLADALRLVEAQAAETGIETRLEAQGDVPPVAGDEDSLRSLFTNLIINGVQAMEGDGAGGRLTVTLAPADEPNRVRVEVTDTGRGIAPENVSQVFEPYFSTKETGTGLGLAIVKKAVEDHGGTIVVRSQPGAGTAFTITLPTERRDEG